MNDVPLASRLVGKKIGRWQVIEKRQKTEEDCSGYYSTCYTVTDDEGKIAFLKAYNYIYAFGSKAGSADALKFMTENFTYERDLLSFCSDHKMRRVVTAIDSGEYIEKGELIPVPYLVFEIAYGSLKTQKIVENPNIAWKLSAFHGVLVGLSQLHSANIVHQDIKPSNILIFGKSYSKISDLGSATQFDNPSNWINVEHVGDRRYAPVELLYEYYSHDWDTRRYGADLFMMGGILSFMLTNSNFLGLMLSKLPENKHPNNFGGSFEEVKPYLLKAYSETLEEIEIEIPGGIRGDLVKVLSELSHPIPEERGNPKKLQIIHRQYSLQRYISIIDRLAKYSMWTKL
jgi:serine/threonine protein kinase